MKILFLAFLITYCLAFAEVLLFISSIENKIDFKLKNFKIDNIKDFILKILFPVLSIILVLTLIILSFKISIFAFIFFLLFNFCLLVAILAIYDLRTTYNSSENIVLIFLAAVAAIFFLVLFGFGTIDVEYFEKSMTVPLYNCSNSSDMESILLKITDEEDENLYIAMEYNKNDTKNIELPIKLSDFSKCKITKDSDNEIIINSKLRIYNCIFSYFGFCTPSQTQTYEYFLYINENCIKNLRYN